MTPFAAAAVAPADPRGPLRAVATVRWLGLAVAASSVLLLAACSGMPGGKAGGAAAESAGAPIRTESDLTDAERRARPRLELAEAYFSRGQWVTALDEVKLALNAKPDMPEALGLRGLIYAALNEPALAEESFRRALAVAPGDGNIIHNYGWFLCSLKRYDEADAQFAAALRQHQYREVQRTWLARGVCATRSGKLVEAESALQRAFELDPSSPVPAYHLAEALLRKGDLERARFYARRVNGMPDAVTPGSLWLAARIEHRMGNLRGAQAFGHQLQERFPQSQEAARFEKGQFND